MGEDPEGTEIHGLKHNLHKQFARVVRRTNLYKGSQREPFLYVPNLFDFRVIALWRGCEVSLLLPVEPK